MKLYILINLFALAASSTTNSNADDQQKHANIGGRHLVVSRDDVKSTSGTKNNHPANRKLRAARTMTHPIVDKNNINSSGKPDINRDLWLMRPGWSSHSKDSWGWNSWDSGWKNSWSSNSWDSWGWGHSSSSSSSSKSSSTKSSKSSKSSKSKSSKGGSKGSKGQAFLGDDDYYYDDNRDADDDDSITITEEVLQDMLEAAAGTANSEAETTNDDICTAEELHACCTSTPPEFLSRLEYCRRFGCSVNSCNVPQGTNDGGITIAGVSAEDDNSEELEELKAEIAALKELLVQTIEEDAEEGAELGVLIENPNP